MRVPFRSQRVNHRLLLLLELSSEYAAAHKDGEHEAQANEIV